MKIAIGSDLHIDWGNINLTNTDSADILILAGDICVATDLEFTGKAKRIHNFFNNCSKEFKDVIYISGNHEMYNGDYHNTIPLLKKHLSYIKNLHILDNEVFTLEDITFIGGTLWSDMNRSDPKTISDIRYMLGDFKYATNSTPSNIDNPPKFMPKDYVIEHNKMLEFIKSKVDDKPNTKFIVVGHHGVSHRSISPKFKDCIISNGAFVSSLDEFILNRPQIRLWFSGHTHERHQYYIGNTLITNNARGYNTIEDSVSTFNLQYIDTNSLPDKENIINNPYWLFHPED
jgi:predicted phosphodiesterase